jgi:1,4-dihydroxy-2-naphthoate polyprenyltransferase
MDTTAQGPAWQVHCDAEGRLTTCGAAAQAWLGYDDETLPAGTRLERLVPWPVALIVLPKLVARTRARGTDAQSLVLRHRDGSMRPATVTATVTAAARAADSVQPSSLRLQIEPLTNANAAAFLPTGPRVHLARWARITRAPFLTATLAPVLLAAAWVWAHPGGTPFSWLRFVLALLGASLLHAAANTFNDYFDWASGCDQGNLEFFAPFSGGSRTVELGLLAQRRVLTVALTCSLMAAAIGIALYILAGPGIIVFGLIGLGAAWAYTSPTVRLAARRGLGELTVALCFGPLMTAGMVYAMTGTVHGFDFVLGIPLGLLTTAILWINQFPDVDADARVGKNNLVVTMGRQRARWGYVLLVAAPFVLVGAAVAANVAGVWSLLALLALPLATYATVVVIRHWNDRSLVRANAATIQLHLVTGVLLCIGALMQRWWG